MHLQRLGILGLGLTWLLSACEADVQVNAEQSVPETTTGSEPDDDGEGHGEPRVVTADGLTVTLPSDALDSEFAGAKLGIKAHTNPSLTDPGLIALTSAKITLTDHDGNVLPSGSLFADLTVEAEITPEIWNGLSEEQRQNLVVVIRGGSDDAPIILPLSTSIPGKVTITVPKEFVEGAGGEALLTIATGRPSSTMNRPPVLANASAQTYATTADVSLTFTNTGAASMICSISPALPTGLSLALIAGSCQIIGVPTVPQSAEIYTVTATAADGSTDTAKVSIAVNVANPPVFSLIADQSFPATAKITPWALTNTGAATASCSVAPPLPTGLSIAVSGSTCTISGTPTASTAKTAYHVTATGVDGSKATTGFNITIGAAVPPLLVDQTSQVYTTTVAISTLVFTNIGGAIVSCSVAPMLPAGLIVLAASGTCQITGMPTAPAASAVYTVTGSDAYSASVTATVQIAVATAVLPQLADAAAQTYVTTVAISALSFVNSGGAAAACSVSPELPEGLAVAVGAGTCRIIGTPTTAQAPTTYTITATAVDYSQDTATVSIAVTAAVPPALADATSKSYYQYQAIAPVAFANSGAAATQCSCDPGLPAGLSLQVIAGTCEVSGTPTTIQEQISYTVTAFAADGSEDSATAAIAVTAPVGPYSHWQSQFTLSSRASSISYAVDQAYIDLSLIPDDDVWWSNVAADGRDIRLVTDTNVELPFLLENFNRSAKTGVILFKSAEWISTTTDKLLRIYAGNGGVTMPAYDIFGTAGSPATFFDLSQDPTGTAPQITDFAGGHNGTVHGNMSPGSSVPGKLGRSLAFDGSNYVVLPTVDLSSTSNVTLSAWVYYDLVGEHVALETGPDSSDYSNVPSLYFGSSGNGTMVAATRGYVGWNQWYSAIYQTGRWYHVTAIFDLTLSSNEAVIYLNGKLSGGKTGHWGTHDFNNSGPFRDHSIYIGKRPSSGDGLHGKLDNLALYYRAMTPEEIETRHRNEESPAGIWVTAAVPTFSVSAGHYDEPQSVELSTPTAGATIYYTVDGSTPTISSTVYSAPIAVTSSTTIKAIAVKVGMPRSPVVTASYLLGAVLGCDDDWVFVPEYSDASLATVPAFCVMKYEAKDVAGSVVSNKQGYPLTYVDRGTSASLCQALGPGYDLMTNSQWQSIARQIETAVDAGLVSPNNLLNWSNNSKDGANFINRGNSSGYSWTTNASDDGNPCYETYHSSCADNSHSDFSQKRTHTLPNGEVIWDIAGNASEWVKDDSSFNYGMTSYWSIVGEAHGSICVAPSCTGPQGRAKAAFGPFGDYVSKTSGEYGGLGQTAAQASGGAIVRGGHSYDSLNAGIFAVNLHYSSASRDYNLGFRCATEPKVINPPVFAAVEKKTFALGADITPVTFVNSGEPAVSCSVEPALPAGLALTMEASSAPATCKIAGRPTASVTETVHTIIATAADSSKGKVNVRIEVPADFPDTSGQTCVVLDTFTAADGTNFNGYRSDTGQLWINATWPFFLQGNRLMHSSYNYSGGWSTFVESGISDMTISVEQTDYTVVRIPFRFDSATNTGWKCEIDWRSPYMQLVKYQAGSVTGVKGMAISAFPNASYTIEAAAVGDRISCRVGNHVLTVVGQTFQMDATVHGLSADENDTFDNFCIKAVVD